MLSLPSYHAIAAMVITILMFVGFVRGRMSIEIVSLLTIAVIAVGLYFFPLEGTRPIDGLALAFGGFGHYALITICALMVMGRGLVVTGALEPAARILEQVFKVNLQIGLLVSLLIAFFLSMFVNNTPVLVLMIPIFAALAQRGAMPTSKTLMPLNSASLLGGMATTIGTSTNILVVSIAVDLGMREIGVFDFTPIVLLASLVALPFIWLVTPRLLGDNRVEADDNVRRFHTRLRIAGDSALIGKDVSEIQPTLPRGITIHEQTRGPLQAQQRLHISGSHEALEDAVRVLKGELAPSWVLDRIRRLASAQGTDIMAVEMTVTADSRLISRTLPSSGIADLYGVAVLGIHRPDRLLGGRDQYSEGGDLRIVEGDVLLVMGLQDDLEAFSRGTAC
ncbi:SLC13 family permease [Erythrobacter sp. JK5]|uniref:SLC13 family permease n=1 Tax=Erythrobacter sp. JK5 TaxID=2829500 RepID=UPI0020136DC1|nr:SLC13 family permease [Erythrobacter sp. JK5]